MAISTKLSYNPSNLKATASSTADAIRQASSAAQPDTTTPLNGLPYYTGLKTTPSTTPSTTPMNGLPYYTGLKTSTPATPTNSGTATVPTTGTTPAATTPAATTSTTTGTTPPTPTPPATPSSNATTTPPIDYAAQLKAAMDASLAATVGTYTTERDKIGGQVTSANNASSSQGMVNAQHIRDTLAQMGLLKSGESSSEQLANDMNTDNNINTNRLQGQQLDASYADKIAAAQAQNALDYADRSYQINRDTVADTQWDKTFTQREAEFATTSAQAQQQINNQASQFAQSLGMSERQLAAQIAQTGAANSIAQAGLAQSASQFASQMQMSQQQYNASLAQWALNYNAGLDQQDFENGVTVGNTTGTYSGDVSSGTPRAVINADGTISIVPVAL